MLSPGSSLWRCAPLGRRRHVTAGNVDRSRSPRLCLRAGLVSMVPAPARKVQDLSCYRWSCSP